MLWNCRENSREFYLSSGGYKSRSHHKRKREYIPKQFQAQESGSGFYSLNSKRQPVAWKNTRDISLASRDSLAPIPIAVMSYTLWVLEYANCIHPPKKDVCPGDDTNLHLILGFQFRRSRLPLIPGPLLRSHQEWVK